jgi:hypothetical protein
MRLLLHGAVVAAFLAAPAAALGLDKRPVSGPAVKEVEEKPTCGNHGTSVDFLDSPQAAAKQAKKEQKLVFVLHVSGNFEDPRFT